MLEQFPLRNFGNSILRCFLNIFCNILACFMILAVNRLISSQENGWSFKFFTSAVPACIVKWKMLVLFCTILIFSSSSNVRMLPASFFCLEDFLTIYFLYNAIFVNTHTPNPLYNKSWLLSSCN